MKVYFAGYGLVGKPLEVLYGLVRHRLISLEYIKDVTLWLKLLKKYPKRSDFMIDSGAYSAWRRGQELNLDTVVDNIQIIQEQVGDTLEDFYCINADVIPGTPNVPATQEQIRDSADKSFNNWKYLTSRGIQTLPVQHQGESLDILKHYLDYGCKYICLSPANDKSKKSRRHYLDMCFTLIKREGYNHVKTHALGLTTQDLMADYPWYSVDSATCPLNASFGKIWILCHGNRLRLVSLTKRLLVHQGDMHYDLIPDIAKREVDRAVEACGLTVARLREDSAFIERNLMNLCTYNKYEDILNGIQPRKYIVPNMEVTDADERECSELTSNS